VRTHFKPEFLNRVDDILIFNPLGQAQLAKIVDLRLADVQQLLADRKITIELTQAAKQVLFREGYRPELRRSSDEADDSETGTGSLAMKFWMARCSMGTRCWWMWEPGRR